MIITGIVNTVDTSGTSQNQTRNTVNESSFAQIMEKIYRGQATAAAVVSSNTAESEKRTSEARAAMDPETLEFLDKYAEIYNKYAAIYGDGFEVLEPLTNTSGNSAVIEAKQRSEIMEAFRAELYEAGIPGELGLKLVTVDDLDNFDLNEMVHKLEVAEPSYISTLFYAEKYGLAGLSKEEQCAIILRGVKDGSVEELYEAFNLMSKIGAITANEAFSLHRSMRTSPGQEDISLKKILDGIKDNEILKDIYLLLSNALEIKEDPEDEKLLAIFRMVDSYQEAIREAIDYRIEKQRELEILDRAAAESTRLRVMFGLDTQGEAAPTEILPTEILL